MTKSRTGNAVHNPVAVQDLGPVQMMAVRPTSVSPKYNMSGSLSGRSWRWVMVQDWEESRPIGTDLNIQLHIYKINCRCIELVANFLKYSQVFYICGFLFRFFSICLSLSVVLSLSLSLSLSSLSLALSLALSLTHSLSLSLALSLSLTLSLSLSLSLSRSLSLSLSLSLAHTHTHRAPHAHAS